jgi:hypothetical protein
VIVALVLRPALPGWTFRAAAAPMVFGLWLHLSEPHEHEHTHRPLAHAHSHRHDEHHRHQHDFA